MTFVNFIGQEIFLNLPAAMREGVPLSAAAAKLESADRCGAPPVARNGPDRSTTANLE